MFEQARRDEASRTRVRDCGVGQRVSASRCGIGQPELSVRTKVAGGDDETNNGLNNAEPIGLALTSCP